MNMNMTNPLAIIERSVHCPYCQKDEAVLICELVGQRKVTRYPDYGKKFWLTFAFTAGVSVLVHGFPVFENKHTFEHVTYGFCPHCGSTYNASRPAEITSTVPEPKVYLRKSNKVINGLCSGIAAYTGLHVLLVRILMVVYGIFTCGIVGLVYLLASACMEQDPDETENW